MTAALPFAVAALGSAAKKVPVGLELYSVRDESGQGPARHRHGRRQDGLRGRGVLRAVSELDPDTAKDVRKRMDDVGLKCHSTHNNGPSFTEDGLKKAIELNQILGSTYMVMASAPRATGIDSWKTVADQLTSISEKLKPLEMGTGYHNHRSNGVPSMASGRWTYMPPAHRRTSSSSSMSARASKSVPTRSRGSTRTPGESRAFTARTGRPEKGMPSPSVKGMRRGKDLRGRRKDRRRRVLPDRAGDRRPRRRARHGPSTASTTGRNRGLDPSDQRIILRLDRIPRRGDECDRNIVWPLRPFF